MDLEAEEESPRSREQPHAKALRSEVPGVLQEEHDQCRQDGGREKRSATSGCLCCLTSEFQPASPWVQSSASL